MNGKKMKEKKVEEKINHSLRNVKRYLGSFNVHDLNEIKIDDIPLFVIINILSNKKIEPYYISIAIYSDEIYICDSKGYLIQCERLPQLLINYLNLIFSNREIHITRQLQNSTANLSAAYSIFFVREMNRFNSFRHFLSYFTGDKNTNDQIISFLY
jgi:hypothetical protein